MKKLLRLFAITTIALSFVACDHLNTETPATNPSQNPEATPASDPTPTPNPNPSSDPVTPVNKDYFVDSVESVADLEGSIWYFASRTTDPQVLATFGLTNYATALYTEYYFDFKGNTFWTYYDITFNENVPEDTRDDIRNDVDHYFPCDLPMTKNANNNNLTLTLFDEDDEETTTIPTISAVFNDGTITATFPNEFAQSLNLGNEIEFKQAFIMFYDGVELSIYENPLYIQYFYEFTENTDFYRSGINIDLTNSGMEKYIQSYIDPDEGFEDEETIYYCRYPDEDNDNRLIGGGILPESYIQKIGLTEGTDYSITHNGYVIDFTTTGNNKEREYSSFCHYYPVTGVYFDETPVSHKGDEILIFEFDDDYDAEEFFTDYTDTTNSITLTKNTDYESGYNRIVLSLSGLTKVLHKEELIYNEEKVYLAVCDGYPTTFVTEKELEELDELHEDDYEIAQNGLIVVLKENGYENLDILRSGPSVIVIPDNPDPNEPDPDDPEPDEPIHYVKV